MFESLLTKKLNIKFFEKTNCYGFEIEDFLSDEQYYALLKNIPDISLNEIKNSNLQIDNKDSQDQLRHYITEVNHAKYDEVLSKNLILSEFVKTIKGPELTNKIMQEFFFKILKSRIFDMRSFLKILLRKNRSVVSKSNSLIDKLLYNDIVSTVEFAYMANGAQSFPHTDGLKKILSLLLYFPDEDVSEEVNKDLGTAFYSSNEFALTAEDVKNKTSTLEKVKKFKERNKIACTFHFKKKSMFGFIKSNKSWNSVEPIKVHDNFIRKNININLLLV